MKLLQTNLVRNISTLAASTLITQAALFAVMPLLTRIYSPTAFGMFATFSALHAITLIFFSLKYDVAIIVPREDGDARNALALSILIPGCLSALLTLGLSRYLLWTNSVGRHLLLLPVSITSASIYSAFQQWGARHRDYRHYSISLFVNSAFNIAISVTLGVLLADHDEGLVLGFTAGLVASAAYMFWIHRTIAGEHRRTADKSALSALAETAAKYRHMPMQVLPFTILIVIMQSAAPLVLNANYPLAEIGLYAVANRALLAPSSIIGAVIGEPFRAEMAAKVRNGDELTTIMHRLLLFLFTISSVAFAVIFAIAPPLFGWLFGSEFARSGEIARALCLGAVAQFIVLPITQVFVITGQMKQGLIAQALVALVPTVAIYIASHGYSIEEALMAWSIAMCASSLVLVALAYRSTMIATRHLSGTDRLKDVNPD